MPTLNGSQLALPGFEDTDEEVLAQGEVTFDLMGRGEWMATIGWCMATGKTREDAIRRVTEMWKLENGYE